MILRRKLKALGRDTSGATIIEFAILAPMFLTMLFGIFVAANYVQSYNAVRSMAADATREVVIAYQRGNNLSESEIIAIARGVAVSAPYFLKTDQLSITATPETSSRVTGTTEYDLNMSYRMESFVPIVKMPPVTLNYSRPIFVVPNASSSGASST